MRRKWPKVGQAEWALWCVCSAALIVTVIFWAHDVAHWPWWGRALFVFGYMGWLLWSILNIIAGRFVKEQS